MMVVLNSLSAGAALLLVFLILTNPQRVNITANRWLSVFILCIFAQLIEAVLYEVGAYHRFPWLIGLNETLFFLIPPCFYLAVRHYVMPDRGVRAVDAVHFILFFLFAGAFTFFLFFMSSETKLQALERAEKSSESQHDLQDILITLSVLTQMLTYWGLSFRSINRHQANIQRILSSEETVNLMWLKQFLIGFLLMALLWGTSNLMDSLFVDAVSDWVYFGAVFFLSYHALHQGEVYSFDLKQKQEIQEFIEANGSSTTEKKPFISSERLAELRQQLLRVMEQEKPYLDNDLTLPKLSELVQTKMHILSYVINEGSGENFSQFVNRYRVGEAQKLLKDPEKDYMNMLGIAFEAGFNSKTAFNTAFKKICGISPSDYKNQAKPLHSPGAES